MFGDFVFPDEEGTKPCWESLSWLQKDFMVWFNKERLRTIITFPVESFAIVYKDGKFLDEDYEANAMAINALEKQEKIKDLLDSCTAYPDDMCDCLVEIEKILRSDEK